MVLIFFFFKSKSRNTRYWRDWSSAVCSPDLGGGGAGRRDAEVGREQGGVAGEDADRGPFGGGGLQAEHAAPRGRDADRARAVEIGRAACRERVEISVVAVSLKKKKVRNNNNS